MKKKYIQPTVSVSFVVFITFSKQHDFTDDSFDTAWPKNKSPWED